MIRETATDPLRRLAALLARLPGIGEKSALRLALAIVRGDPEYAKALGESIADIHDHVRECRICADLCASEICDVCRDPRRDRRVVCVVAQPQDRIALEKSGAYRGLYHVLHGVLDPLGGIGPDQLRVRELLARLGGGRGATNGVVSDPSSGGEAAKASSPAADGAADVDDAHPEGSRHAGGSPSRAHDTHDTHDTITEVIVATSPNVEGDATALYLSRLLAPLGVRVTRIASGVAVGGELEYADLSTLQRALADRRSL